VHEVYKLPTSTIASKKPWAGRDEHRLPAPIDDQGSRWADSARNLPVADLGKAGDSRLLAGAFFWRDM
jgi:hypothetical protein